MPSDKPYQPHILLGTAIAPSEPQAGILQRNLEMVAAVLTLVKVLGLFGLALMVIGGIGWIRRTPEAKKLVLIGAIMSVVCAALYFGTHAYFQPAIWAMNDASIKLP
jgi:hypothetical protein